MKLCSKCHEAPALPYYAWCRDCKNAYKRDWCATHPPSEEERTKQRVRVEAMNAYRQGRILWKPCRDCGSVETVMHHDDYARPYDVVWLCVPCHTEHHRRIKALNQNSVNLVQNEKSADGPDAQ